MAERPILFSGPLVRRILADEKTQTRRLVDERRYKVVDREGVGPWPLFRGPAVPGTEWMRCPHGKPGDVLWVRETLRRTGEPPYYGAKYAADDRPLRLVSKGGHTETDAAWTFGERSYCPSIHMPRAVARLFLRVTNVRVERLQDISEEDIIAEGVEPYRDFECCGRPCGHLVDGPECCGRPDEVVDFKRAWVELWDSINGKRDGASWDANPWVWVVEFERIEEAANG